MHAILAAILAATLIPALVAAQSGDATVTGIVGGATMMANGPASSPESAEYAELLRLGVEEFTAGNWAEARVLFTRAHDLKPTARTLRTLGMVEFELRNYPASIQALEQAMIDPRTPLTDEQRSAASELLTRARRYVGTCAVEIDGATEVKLFVDDTPLSLEGGSTQLGVGKHRIRATSPQHDDQVRTVEIHSGATELVRFSFPQVSTPMAGPMAGSVPDAGPVSVPNRAPVDSATAPPADRGNALPWAPIAVTAVGGALLIGALATGAAASAAESDLEDLCDDQIPCVIDADRQSLATDLQDEADTLAGVTNGLLVAGGAAAVGGLIWLALVGFDDGSTAVSLVPAVAPRFAGLGARGRF